MKSNNRLTQYEEDFEYVSQFIDIELFALELEHALDKPILEAVRKQSDQRKAEFERAVASHPDTIAEQARWKANREEMQQRMARLRPLKQAIPVRRAAKQLARRWGLVS